MIQTNSEAETDTGLPKRESSRFVCWKDYWIKPKNLKSQAWKPRVSKWIFLT